MAVSYMQHVNHVRAGMWTWMERGVQPGAKVAVEHLMTNYRKPDCILALDRELWRGVASRC